MEGEAAQGPAPGTRISALVLDRNPADGIVDLSLLPRLTEAEAAAKSEPSAKKGKRKGVEAASPKQPKLGDQLECVIELVSARAGRRWLWLGFARRAGRARDAQRGVLINRHVIPPPPHPKHR